MGLSDTGVAVLTRQQAVAAARQQKRDAASNDEQPAIIKLTDAQIAAAGIELAPVQDGTLARRITVRAPSCQMRTAIARVSVKLSATVAELRKNLGDTRHEGRGRGGAGEPRGRRCARANISQPG